MPNTSDLRHMSDNERKGALVVFRQRIEETLDAYDEFRESIELYSEPSPDDDDVRTITELEDLRLLQENKANADQATQMLDETLVDIFGLRGAGFESYFVGRGGAPYEVAEAIDRAKRGLRDIQLVEQEGPRLTVAELKGRMRKRLQDERAGGKAVREDTGGAGDTLHLTHRLCNARKMKFIDGAAELLRGYVAATAPRRPETVRLLQESGVRSLAPTQSSIRADGESARDPSVRQEETGAQLMSSSEGAVEHSESRPKEFVEGYKDIFAALGIKHRDQRDYKVACRSFKRKCEADGAPVKFRNKKPPIVEKGPLLGWWNSQLLAKEARDQAAIDREATLSEGYQHGRVGTEVKPNLAGYVRKRAN